MESNNSIKCCFPSGKMFNLFPVCDINYSNQFDPQLAAVARPSTCATLQ